MRRIFFALMITAFSMHAVFRTNVLQPYNIILQPDPLRETRFSFQVGYEGIVAAQGFSACDSGHNVLQLFQCEQDALAALKGFGPETEAGQLAQRFNIDDANGTHGLFVPHGDLIIPLNLMLGIQGRLAHNVSLHAYMPVIYAELKDVCWREKNEHITFEDNSVSDLLCNVAQLGGMNLFNGWKRAGCGDAVIFFKWQNDFTQIKPLLRTVRLSVRAGFNLPTGAKEDICDLLGLPFGYDQGLGAYFAGFLGLHFIHNVRFMIDLEFLQLFGNTRTRRIKTDNTQTDLLLIAKDRVYVDPGFTQQYTFMLQKRSCWRGLNAALYYQYFKHNDDTYYPTTNFGNFAIINDAQSVQDYTTHQFVFKLDYEFNQNETDCSRPNIALFGKYGFNGKRAIVTSSVGLQFTYAF